MSAPKAAGGKKGAAATAGKKRKADAGLADTEKTAVKNKRGLFSKDLRLMMYGHGDDANSYQETVDLVEDIVVDWITAITQKAMEQAAYSGGKVTPAEIIYMVRKDPKKFQRARELLKLNEEIKQAKKAFEDDETKLKDD
ncbi:hypothetical protein WJX72_002114 [[Myrmecia] bisecta]|uniref:Transcription initiation factor TFIID subunit 13 n=1 Tax=[Myrmecia] bisecta TaxID=41462 RepID=A0AAW1Q3G6_9CHLO